MEKTGIFTIRLSPEGIALWTNDTVDARQWDAESMSVVRTSDEKEIYLPFDGRADARGRVAGFMAQLGVISKTFSLSAPERVVVCIDTPKTVMVPAELYREGAAGQYLSIHNMSAAAGEQVDVSKPVHGTVAVMASDSAMMEHLGKALGEFKVVAPLQYNLMLGPIPRRVKKGEAYVLLYNAPQRAYVSVFAAGGRRELLYNDVFPAAGGSDIIYYLDRLKRQFPVSGSTLFVGGFDRDRLAEAAGHYFSRVACV